MDPARSVYERGYVAIDRDGRIAGVGSAEDAPRAGFDEMIDVAGSIVLPGLINLHQHHWHTLLKGLGVARPPAAADDAWHGHPLAVISAADLRLAARLSAIEM